MNRSSTFAFALLSVLATGSAVNAAPYSNIAISSAGYHQVVVSYSDLDLSQPDGAKAMLSRLQVAARNVCGKTYSERDVSTLWASRACNKQAMNRAVASINAPLVAELYGVPALKSGSTPSRLASN
jgi:UrcA family protein